MEKQAKESAKHDLNAASRSSIRRHPSVHGRRGVARTESTDQDAAAASGLRRARDAFWDSDVLPPVPDPAPASEHVQSTIHLRDGTPLTAATDRTPGYYANGRIRPDRHAANRARRTRTRSRHTGEPELAATARRSLRRRETSDAFIPPMFEHSRPLSSAHAILPSPSEILERNNATSRANLPTPPLDTSVLSQDEIMDHMLSSLPHPDELRARNTSSPHPLSGAPRAMSPDNGLGDRRRSASPSADVWQVMRSTITPDDSLPSTSSSFTSAAAATASFSWSPPDESNDADSTAPTHLRSPTQPADRDISFDETMREMGLAVSSSSADDSEDSITDDSDENMSDSDSDDDSDTTSDEDSDSDLSRVERAQRRHVAQRLYDIAMTTPEGREQIENLRHPTMPQQGHLESSRDLPTPSSISGHHHQEPPRSTSTTEPEHRTFGAEVHDRAHEATSRTHAFFDQARSQERDAQLERARSDLEHSVARVEEARALMIEATELRRAQQETRRLNRTSGEFHRRMARDAEDQSRRRRREAQHSSSPHPDGSSAGEMRFFLRREHLMRHLARNNATASTNWMLARPLSQRDGQARVSHL